MVWNTKVSRNAAATEKKDFIATKKAVLSTLCKSIYILIPQVIIGLYLMVQHYGKSEIQKSKRRALILLLERIKNNMIHSIPQGISKISC